MSKWKSLNGTEWDEEVGKLWDANKSRFGLPWSRMLHHDRVTVFRILIAAEAQEEKK